MKKKMNEVLKNTAKKYVSRYLQLKVYQIPMVEEGKAKTHTKFIYRKNQLARLD